MTWNFPYRPWYQPSTNISALQLRCRAWYGSLGLIPGPIWKMSCNNLLLLYSYNFNPIKNTYLRHMIVLYFSRIVQPKAVYFPYWTSNTEKIRLPVAHYVREVTRWFLFSASKQNKQLFMIITNIINKYFLIS